jgi:hypothetical protein
MGHQTYPTGRYPKVLLLVSNAKGITSGKETMKFRMATRNVADQLTHIFTITANERRFGGMLVIEQTPGCADSQTRHRRDRHRPWRAGDESGSCITEEATLDDAGTISRTLLTNGLPVLPRPLRNVG